MVGAVGIGVATKDCCALHTVAHSRTSGAAQGTLGGLTSSAPVGIELNNLLSRRYCVQSIGFLNRERKFDSCRGHAEITVSKRSEPLLRMGLAHRRSL